MPRTHRCACRASTNAFLRCPHVRYPPFHYREPCEESPARKVPVSPFSPMVILGVQQRQQNLCLFAGLPCFLTRTSRSISFCFALFCACVATFFFVFLLEELLACAEGPRMIAKNPWVFRTSATSSQAKRLGYSILIPLEFLLPIQKTHAITQSDSPGLKVK